VKCLGAQYRVAAAVGYVHRLRGASYRAEARHTSRQLGPHRVHGLDCNNFGSVLDKQLCKLSRACTQINHRRFWTEANVPVQPNKKFVWIIRATTSIGRSRVAKALERHSMDIGHYRSPPSTCHENEL
jgi:hypothetical protein